MVKINDRTAIIAKLNNEELIFLTNKLYASALSKYIGDLVKEYEDNPPPQSLKDFVVEMVLWLEDADIEIIKNCKTVTQIAII